VVKAAGPGRSLQTGRQWCAEGVEGGHSAKRSGGNSTASIGSSIFIIGSPIKLHQRNKRLHHISVPDTIIIAVIISVSPHVISRHKHKNIPKTQYSTIVQILNIQELFAGSW